MIETFLLDSHKMRLRRMRQRIRSFVDLAGDKPMPFKHQGKWVIPEGACPGKWAMITLTYAAVNGWRPDHVSKFIDAMQKHCVRHFGNRLPYVWVAELQERGAVHYHVLVKLPSKEVRLPKPDEQGWWKHGLSQIAWVRKSGKRYMAKYASKAGQKAREQFPSGLRMCGAGGLPEAAKAWWRFLLAPGYVREACEPADLPQRVPGGFRLRNRINEATGQPWFIPSRWIGSPQVGGFVRVTKLSVDDWAKRFRDWNPLLTHQLREKWDALMLACSETVRDLDLGSLLFCSNRAGFVPGYSWDGAGFVPVERPASPGPAMCERKVFPGWENGWSETI